MEITFVEEAYYKAGHVLAYGYSKQTIINEDSVLAVTDLLGIPRDQENLIILIADQGFESSCIADYENNRFTIIVNLIHVEHLFCSHNFFLNLNLMSFKEQVTFILAHELQHFIQYQNGSIKATFDVCWQTPIWKNKIDMGKEEVNAALLISNGDKNAYFNLPWEHEANTVARSVTSTLFPTTHKGMWRLIRTDIFA